MLDATTATALETSFLAKVPDMLALDASLTGTATAIRSAEGVSKGLRKLAPQQQQLAALVDSSPKQPVPPSPPPPRHASSTTTTHTLYSLFDSLESATAEHRYKDAIQLLRRLESLSSSSSSTPPPSPLHGGGSNGHALSYRWELEYKTSQATSKVISSLIAAISLPEPIYDASLRPIRPLLAMLLEVARETSTLHVLLSVATSRFRENVEYLLSGYHGTAAPSSGAAAEEATLDQAAALGQSIQRCLQGTLDAVHSLFIDTATTATHGNGGVSKATAAAVYGAVSGWMVTEVVGYGCDMLKRSVLIPRAVPTGLPPSCRCVSAFILPFTHTPDAVAPPKSTPQKYGDDVRTRAMLMRCACDAVWPSLESVLLRRSRQLAEGLRKAAASEIKHAAGSAMTAPMDVHDAAAWEVLVSVFPSAKRLLIEMKTLSTAIVPIATPSAVNAMRTASSLTFQVGC